MVYFLASFGIFCLTAYIDVLYYAKKSKYWDIDEEIGQKEGELIRKNRPVLNT